MIYYENKAVSYSDVSDHKDRKKCPYSGKVIYTKRDAGEVINDLRKSWRKARGSGPCSYYYCKDCGGYHLTHYRTNTGSSSKTYRSTRKREPLKEIYVFN